MSRNVVLQLIAWIGAPLGFAVYVSWSYLTLASMGALPFLGPPAWPWWTAFILALSIGAGCIVAARWGVARTAVASALIYLGVMAALIIGVQFAVACWLSARS